MRRSKFVSAMGLLATCALILSACGGGETTSGGTNTQAQKPEELGKADQVYTRPTVAPSGDFTVVREEPYTAYNNSIGANNNFSNTVVLALQQPSPYFFDLINNEQIVIKLDGDVMESVTVTSKNPMKVEWKINKKAVWSDGIPVSCKDFYLQWLAGASKVTIKGDEGEEVSVWDSSPTGYEDISKVECADGGKTVKTEFSKVFADYRGGIFNPMLPAHILEQNAGIADITKLTTEDEKTNPTNAADVKKAAEFYTKGWAGFDAAKALSAGPYVTQSFSQEEVVLVRNPKWWGGKPGPDKITVRVNRDAQSAAQQLTNKEVDVIAIQADSAVAQQLRGNSSVTTFALAGQTYEHIDFNLAVPVFKNKEFRQAVAACVNRKDIIDKLVRDVDPNAKAQGSFMFMYNELGYEDHYGDTGNGNAEAAKKILTDAGWTQGADGIMTKGGVRASFKLGHKTLERRANTVRLVASHCRPAGIEILDDQADNFNAKRLPASDYEAALFAWVGTAVKSSAYGNYACKPAGTANYNNYCNAEVDKLYLAANQELDFDKRIAQLNQVDKLMRDDMHSLPLFVLPDFAAASSNIKPISYVGTFGGVTWNAFAWQR